MKNLKGAIHKSFRFFGLDLVKYHPPENVFPPDFAAEEIEIVRKVRPWTLTTPERIYALVHTVRYVSLNNIPGSIVECGVWQGGSMAAVAHVLLQLNDVSRDLYLFDTFEGMTEPTARDVDYEGMQVAQVWEADVKYVYAPLEAVQEVMYATGYPRERIHFVRGRVEDTLPKSAPESVAILRLDTDWYESTRHELIHLFPRLSKAGVLIIDDYGHWRGSREATDEYFSQNRIPILLNRIDYSCRLALKP
jgi:hypothetical protein